LDKGELAERWERSPVKTDKVKKENEISRCAVWPDHVKRIEGEKGGVQGVRSTGDEEEEVLDE